MERLRGFRDFYPEPLPHLDVWSANVRQYIFQKWRESARVYHFEECDGPPLEPLELYTLKSGEEIVGQLYHFIDKGERKVALRPEMTPTVARLVASHQRNYKRPIKWFSIPQLFRYERQQAGRLREHFQFNADIFGEASPAVDAELISLLIDSLRGLKLTAEDFVVRLSSRQVWQSYFEERAADLGKANEFFQVIDKLERDPLEESERKLEALGFSLGEVQEFIRRGDAVGELGAILENLRARGLEDYVRIDYGVIRGLAYYTGVVFEAFDRKGTHRAIAGGGRYENLVKLVSKGKVDLPAIGFGMGDVVLTLLLRERGLLPDLKQAVDVYVLIEEETQRSAALRLVEDLRQAGISVEYSLEPSKPEKQFKRAVENGVRHVIRWSGPEIEPKEVLLRDLRTRTEERVSREEVVRRCGGEGLAG